MKTSYLILSISVLSMLLPFTSKAQSSINDVASLSKYSYPIFTLINQRQHTGTAFFYYWNDTSYLVSNYHAIKGMSPVSQTINFNTDTLYLKYPVKNSTQYKVMAIDISDSITGQTEVFSMVDRIDLMKIAVELPKDADIFFINELVEEEYLYAEPEQIVAFGHPTQPGSIPTFYSRQQQLEGLVNPVGFVEYDSSLKQKYPAAADSTKAVINATSRYYYFIKPYAARGYSGAPVFGRFRGSNDEPIYRFTGVIFAGQVDTKQTWAIKGDVALKYLEGE